MKKIVIILLLSILVIGSAGVGAYFVLKPNHKIEVEQTSGATISVDQLKAREGKEVKITSTVDNGYTFSYYIVDGKQIEGSSFIMPDKDVKISAKLETVNYSISYKNINEYTINPNTTSSYTVTTNDITLEDPTRSGYAFAGWYKDSVFENKIDEIAKGSFGNLELYAKWEALFTYNTSGVLTGVTDYAKNGGIETLIIPASIDGQAITEVGAETQIPGGKYKNIVVEKGITKFGTHAFKGGLVEYKTEKISYTGTLEDWCEIDFMSESSNPTMFCTVGADLYIDNVHVDYTLNLPDITYIKPYSFYGVVDIVVLNFANKTTAIGVSAFEHCKNLAMTDLSNIVTIQDKAFMWCEKLTKINYKDGSVNKLDSVQTIGNSAFSCAGLESIGFNDNLSSIGDFAFFSSYLKSVDLDAYRLTSVGEHAFENCDITELIIDTLYDLTLGTNAFNANENLTEIYLRSNTGKVNITDTTFKDCGLTAVYIYPDMMSEYTSSDDWSAYSELLQSKS